MTPQNSSQPKTSAFEAHSSGAMRQNMKSRYDLVPFEMIEAYQRVAEFGAIKYTAHNWQKGLPRMQIAASLIRHVWKYMVGEDNDPESGLPHTDHIVWNAAALCHHHTHGIEDDRRKMPQLPWQKSNTITPLSTIESDEA